MLSGLSLPHNSHELSCSKVLSIITTDVIIMKTMYNRFFRCISALEARILKKKEPGQEERFGPLYASFLPHEQDWTKTHSIYWQNGYCDQQPAAFTNCLWTHKHLSDNAATHRPEATGLRCLIFCVLRVGISSFLEAIPKQIAKVKETPWQSETFQHRRFKNIGPYGVACTVWKAREVSRAFQTDAGSVTGPWIEFQSQTHSTDKEADVAAPPAMRSGCEGSFFMQASFTWSCCCDCYYSVFYVLNISIYLVRSLQSIPVNGRYGNSYLSNRKCNDGGHYWIRFLSLS